MLFFGSEDNYIYAVVVASGKVAWKFKTGDEVWASPSLGGDERSQVVYIGSGDTHVYALNSTDGSMVWKYKTDGAVQSRCIVSNDGALLFIPSLDEHVYVR